MSDDGRDDGPDPALASIARAMGEPEGVADRLADKRPYAELGEVGGPHLRNRSRPGEGAEHRQRIRADVD